VGKYFFTTLQTERNRQIMKKYLAGLAAVSVAGGAAPTLDSVQAAPEQNTQKAATTVQDRQDTFS
ncbi:hypothetical protein ACT4UM_03350, partial [Bacillus sp. SS-TM]